MIDREDRPETDHEADGAGQSRMAAGSQNQRHAASERSTAPIVVGGGDCERWNMGAARSYRSRWLNRSGYRRISGGPHRQRVIESKEGNAMQTIASSNAASNRFGAKPAWWIAAVG